MLERRPRRDRRRPAAPVRRGRPARGCRRLRWRDRGLRDGSTPATAPRRSSPTTSRACSPATAPTPRARSGPSPSPGGCAAPRCRTSRTPTAGSCSRRGDGRGGAPLSRARRGGAAGRARWCSTTSAPPSPASAGSEAARASLERAIAAAGPAHSPAQDRRGPPAARRAGARRGRHNPLSGAPRPRVSLSASARGTPVGRIEKWQHSDRMRIPCSDRANSAPRRRRSSPPSN